MKANVYIETTVVSYHTARPMKDPIVAEVRKHRMEHTRRFNGDLHLICEDLRQFEATLGKRVVRPEPKRLRPTGGSTTTQ